MSWYRITNLETGKVEEEAGLQQLPHFMDKSKASNPEPPTIKTTEQLQTDLMAEASYQDFRKGRTNE